VKFLYASWKALAAGLAAGAVAFQSGQNLSLSVAAGVGAFALTWVIPNQDAA
jgi:hypothetical protein